MQHRTQNLTKEPSLFAMDLKKNDSTNFLSKLSFVTLVVGMGMLCLSQWCGGCVHM